MKLTSRIFQIFILLLPTQLGFHFWPLWAFVSGIRIDYLSPTIYLTDLVFIVLFLVWIFEERVKFKIKRVLFLIVLFAFFNVAFAFEGGLTFYKWIKVFEFIAISFYVFSNKEVALKLIKTPLSLAVIYTSGIALGQILLQRTLGGPFYLLGERSFTVSTPGISLVDFMGRALMRPYATFPHPNALAGFLLVSIFILLTYKSKSFINWFAIAIGSVIVFLTFSQNAWIVFFIMLFLSFFQKRRKWGSIKKLVFFLVLLFSLILPIISQILISNRTVTLMDLSIERRLVLSDISGILFSRYPVFGVGLGGFIPSMAGILRTQNFLVTETIWWLQPVHNIYLLILSEAGIVGFLLFCFLVYKILLKTKSQLDLGLIIILLLGFLDHYWLTLQQNFLLFALITGFLIQKELIQYKSYGRQSK